MKKNNEHVRTRTFVCTAFLSNPGSNVGSLRKVCLELEMIAKRQTADVSFHRVCETVTIICLKYPLRKYSLFRLEKDKMFVNLRTWTGLNRKLFYFESVCADVSLFRLLLAFYYTISRRRKECLRKRLLSQWFL